MLVTDSCDCHEIEMDSLKHLVSDIRFFILQVYSIKALRMITDAQFQSMGVAVGQVAAIKAAFSEEGVPQFSKGTNKKTKEFV